MAEPAPPTPAGPRWDLRLLYPDDEAALAEATAITEALAEFEQTYQAVFTDSADRAREALDALAALRARTAMLAAYGAGRFVTALSDERANDVSEAIDAVADRTHEVVALTLRQWSELDEPAAEALRGTPALRPFRAVLGGARGQHGRLDDRQAEILQARDPVVDAWADLYDRVTARIRVDAGGNRLTIDQALGLQRTGTAQERRSAADALHDALAGQSDVLAHALDTVIADRLVTDELVGGGGSSDDGELDPAVIDAALAVVEGSAPVAHRWFAAKAAAAGRDRIDLCDLAVEAGGPTYSFADAGRSILAALDRFDPALADVAATVLDGRVDAAPDADKIGNSLCIAAGPAPALVTMNFAGGLDDVITLAHETGHAVHYTLAGRSQHGLTAEPPVVIGEVAAIATELLVYDQLVNDAPDAHTRAAVETARADGLVATVFRQTALARFERDLYGARARQQVLLPDRLSSLWLRRIRELYGPAVCVPDRYGSGWALVPHFVRARYYNRNYTMAALTSVLLWSSWRSAAPASASAELRDALHAGGSATAAALLSRLHMPGTEDGWRRGTVELSVLLRDAARVIRSG